MEENLATTISRNFVQYGIEDFPFSDFVYSLPSGNRVPTLEKHVLEAQDATALPIGAQRSSSSILILSCRSKRFLISLNCSDVV